MKTISTAFFPVPAIIIEMNTDRIVELNVHAKNVLGITDKDGEIYSEEYFNKDYLHEGEYVSHDLLLNRNYHKGHDVVCKKISDDLILLSFSSVSANAGDLAIQDDKYRTLVETSTDCIFILQDGKIAYSNPKLLEVSEYPAKELLNKSFAEFVAPEEKEKLIQYNKKRENGKAVPQKYESVAITKTGKRIDVSVSIISIEYRNRPALYVVLRDITEYKTTLKKLEESEQKFREFANLLPEVVFEIDANLNLVFSNEILEKRIGYSVRDFQSGKVRITDVFSPEDRVKLIKAVEKNLQGIWNNGNIYQLNSPDEPRYVQVFTNPVYTGHRITGVRGIAVEITDRIHAFSELSKSENLHKEIINLAPVGYYHSSKDGSLVRVNRELLDILEYEDENELLNKDIKTIYFDPDERDQLIQKYDRLPDPVVKNLELRLRKKDGSLIWVLLTARAIKDEKGQTRGYDGFVIDITEKNKQESVRELLTSLSEKTGSEKNLEDFLAVLCRELESIFQTSHLQIALFSDTGDDVSFPYFRDQFNPAAGARDIALINYLGKQAESLFLRDPEIESLYTRLFGDNKTPTEKTLIAVPFFATEDSLVSGVILLKDYHPETRYTENDRKSLNLIAAHIGLHISRTKYVEQLKIAIRESEEGKRRYQSLFNNNSSVMLLIDPESGAIVDCNESACSFYKYHKKDLLQKNLYDINALSSEEIRKEMQSARSSNRNYFLFKHLMADGSICDVEVYSGTVMIDGKNMLFSIVHDISQRKKQEEEIARLNLAVKQSPEPIALTDLSGNFIFVNPSFCDNSGYSSEELIGKPVSILKSGKHSPDLYRELWETLNSGRTWSGELINKKKNGELFIEEADITPIINEGGYATHYLKVSRDVTQSRKIEQELKENRNMLKVILDNMPGGYMMIGEDYKIYQVNKQASLITGFSNEEMTGALCDLICPKGSKSKNCPIIEQGKESFHGMDTSIKTKSGEHVPIIKNAQRIVINGKTYIIESFQDISNLKKTEQDLIQARDKAEESDRLKSAFLANMSHEIRTPMNGIMGFANLLSKPEFSDEEKKLFVENIRKSGARMLNTVNDIIEISKIEIGEISLSRERINLVEKLDEILDFFRPEATEKGLGLNSLLHTEKNPDYIYSDTSKLESILTNLVKNAIKYSEKGSINFGYLRHESMIHFFCQDEGIGIPHDRQKAIFNRFEQADISDSRAFQGSGLGLAISKAYVEMLGGKIWVESSPGKGSTFFFTLPDHVSEISPGTYLNQKGNSDPEINHDDLFDKILIIEDDVVSREYLEVIIAPVAKEIIVADSGKKGIELIKKHPDITAVLMDIKMPGISGYEATKEIRQFNKDVIIIAQTAYAMEGDKEKALDSGCDDYISKPVSLSTLLEILNRNIRQKKN